MNFVKGSVYRPATVNGGAGSGEVLYFTNDPTAENIIPRERGRAAIAYSKDGTKPALTWNPDTQAWV